VTAVKKNFKSFESIIDSQGFNFRKSTQEESKEDIDYVVWDPKNLAIIFAVSLKNTLLKKSKKRKHLWGWVELKDSYGKDGWLYKKCTYVVYERKNDFVLVFRKGLRDWIQKENKPRYDLPFVSSSWQAAYRLYRRPETGEAIFHLKISDVLKNCSHKIWKKDEGSS
tara:strand:- start:11670 stop:12170 length:501 start_codon:yes stop_codon:yes gene_type:complete